MIKGTLGWQIWKCAVKRKPAALNRLVLGCCLTHFYRCRLRGCCTGLVQESGIKSLSTASKSGLHHKLHSKGPKNESSPFSRRVYKSESVLSALTSDAEPLAHVWNTCNISRSDLNSPEGFWFVMSRRLILCPEEPSEEHRRDERGLQEKDESLPEKHKP